MAVNASLPVSGLINITASIAAAAVPGQSTNGMLVLGSSAIIDPVTRLRTYTSATAVSTDFGGSAPETLAAEIWFDGNPQPATLDIGRWAEAATAGQLYGAPLSAAQQLPSAWTGITDGGFHIAVDGGGPQNVTGLNFSAIGNMNAVAAVIQAVITGATIVWNSVYSRFIITSSTTGAASSVSFATAGTGMSVVDVSGQLGLLSTSSGAYVANGIAAESALAAVTIFDNTFGQQWYGLSVIGAADSDVEAIFPFLAASSNKHFYFASIQEAAVLVGTDTTDLAYVLKTANASKVAVQYNGSTPYSAVALAAVMLTVDYTGSNTVKAAMWQQEPSVSPDVINTTQLASLLAKNCNAFLAYNNGSAIIQPGICSNGQWIDTTIGADALCLAMQAAAFNLRYTQNIPQTDAGNHQIKIALQKVLDQFVSNGFIAPGVWNGPLFGSLQNNSDGSAPTLATGYYIYQPPIASQNSGQKNARVSVPFQIAANLAGSVQTINVAIILAA